METHSNKFKVRLGIFIIVGLALFTLAIFIIGKQKNLFNPVFKVTATFSNVSGLKIGNNIRFSGINVGTVDNITIINDSTVQVDMFIQQHIKQFIKSDSKVSIGSEGLIGDRLIVVSQGSINAPIVKKNQHLKSVEPMETDAIIASVKRAVENTELITQQFAVVMLKVNSGKGTMGRLIHDNDIAQDIKSTIGNFQNSSKVFDETIKTTQTDLNVIMKSLMFTADNVKVSTHQIEEIMIGVNGGKGTIGGLLKDTLTIKNIDQTILNLKNSSKGLDDNLEALKHNIFFRSYYKKKAKEDLLKKTEEQKHLNLQVEKDSTILKLN